MPADADHPIAEVRLSADASEPFVIGKAVFGSGGVPTYANLGIDPGGLEEIDYGAPGGTHEKDGLRALVRAVLAAHGNDMDPLCIRVLVPVAKGGAAIQQAAYLHLQRFLVRLTEGLTGKPHSDFSVPDEHLQVL